MLSIDSYTRINLKDIYKGSQLSDKRRANITKFQANYVPVRGQPYKLTFNDHMILNLKETLEKKFGTNVLTHILPHYQRPDIILCFDENGKPMTEKIVNCLPPSHYLGAILSKEYLFEQSSELAGRLDSHQLVAVLLGGWNFYLRDTEIPTGESLLNEFEQGFQDFFHYQEDCE